MTAQKGAFIDEHRDLYVAVCKGFASKSLPGKLPPRRDGSAQDADPVFAFGVWVDRLVRSVVRVSRENDKRNAERGDA